MVIIFAIFLTTVFANSQEKYIDLLPDEDKQEFLDKVARRIMESVESNATNKDSRELTDEQLKEHSPYVRSIMEEETAAFEAQRRNRDNKSNEEYSKSEENDSEEFLGVKPLQANDGANKSNVDNVDLTVAGFNRRSYDEIPHESLTNNFGMDNITDNSLPLQKRSVKNDNNSDEEKELPKNSKEEVNDNYQETSTLQSEKPTQEEDSVKSTTPTGDIKIDDTTTALTTYEHDTQYETSSDSSVALPLTTTTSVKEVDSDNTTTITTTDSETQVPEGDSATDSENIYSVTTAAKSYTEDSSDSTLTSSLTDESTTDSAIDTTRLENTDVLSTTLNDNVLTTTSPNFEVNAATTENNNAVTENSLTKEDLETTIETTTFLTGLTPINIEENTKKPENMKLNETLNQSDKDNIVSYIAKKALNKVKSELDLKKIGNFNVNEVETTIKGVTRLNHYKVYEIPWQSKRQNQPFLRSQKPIMDQPHFVPVYKYSPNFAYYNPKNRLGPNEVEENSIELDTRQLRGGDSSINAKAESSKFILQLDNDMRKFGFPKKKKHKVPVHPHSSKEEDIEVTTSIFTKSDEELFFPRSTTAIPDVAEEVVSEGNDSCKTSNESSNEDSCHTSTEKEDEEKKKGTSMTALLDASDPKDVFTNLQKFQNLNIPLMRSSEDTKVRIYMNVLKDLMIGDSKALKQYDWLTTTVQIQSALSKIFELINRVKNSLPIHPADLQILKYAIFLHNFSLEVKETNEQDNKLRKRSKLLPRNKNKRKNKLLKEKGLINRVWLYLRMLMPDLVEENGFNHLYKFLKKVQEGLYDLHEAITYIADVTKFKHQNWYSNLRELYLSTDEKHLRELLLHISMSRLVDLFEHGSKEELDPEFIHFVRSRKKEAKRIIEEMLFINKILDGI